MASTFALLLLVVGLVYTSFATATEARIPSELARSAEPGRVYELTGKVEPGSLERRGEELSFRVRDRAGTASIPVRYRGTVPDPFREGREIIVDVRRQGAVFVGEPGSLITKCPSKFSTEPSA